jgi:hypothetical protein
MHHGLDGIGSKCFFELFRIIQVTVNERDRVDRLPVACLEIIIDNGTMAFFEEFFYHMTPDIPCSSCDQDCRHRHPLSQKCDKSL